MAPVTKASTSNAEAGAASPAAARSGPGGLAPPMFQAALLAHIERFRRYPDEARRDQRQGVVVVGFAMDRQGDLIDLWVDRSSGTTSLDEEALATVRRAQPLPPVPSDLPSPLEVAMPVAFALR